MMGDRPEITPGQRWYAWCYGWTDGAGRKAMRALPQPECATIYEEAYRAGQEANRAATTQAAERFGYEPKMVYTAAGKDDR